MKHAPVDANTAGRMSNATRPIHVLDVDGQGNGVIRATDSNVVFAVVRGGNPLDEAWVMPTQLADCQRLVTWAGSLASQLFDGHPGNWMPVGAERFEASRAEISAQCHGLGVRWCIRPHARHVLSDVMSCRRLLAEQGEYPVGLALDPASMLEPMMLEALDEHLPRMFEALGPAADLVLLGDVQNQDDGEAVVSVDVGSGVLPGEMLGELIQRHVPQAVPIVFPDSDVDRHCRWLGW